MDAMLLKLAEGAVLFAAADPKGGTGSGDGSSSFFVTIFPFVIIFVLSLLQFRVFRGFEAD